MSKRGNDNDPEFWKKIRLGATAVVTVGTGMFAAASVLKHHGMGANFFDEVKAAMQTPPQHTLDMTPGMQQPTDDEESRAVLQMQLEFAQKRNDTQRVEQIQHQLRMLNSNATQSSNMPTQTTQIQMAHMKMPQIHLPNMQMPQMQTPQTQLMQTPQVESTNIDPRHMEGEKFGMLEPNDTSKSGAIEAFAGGSVEHTSGLPKPVESHQKRTPVIQAGDIVEALDPVHGKWVPATVYGFSKGLVKVRWDNPGVDEAGRPFHPIGEVFAEQIRLRHRPAPVMQIVEAPSFSREDRPADPIVPPDGLQVGDTCYALGQMVSKKWFSAKLIGVRANSPPMRVKYISTLDGNTTDLLLPSPRTDYVNIDQVRRGKPVDAVPEGPRRRLEDKVGGVEKATTHDDNKNAAQNQDDGNPTAPQMCGVCDRSVDECNMISCACKKCFHISCLTPQLEQMPEGDWLCPACILKK